MFNEAAFEAHCLHIDAAHANMKQGEFAAALAELDTALGLFESPHARWNRAISLLALGRYAEGWIDYEARWKLFPRLTTPRGERLRQVLPAWNGEPLAGGRLGGIPESG